MRKFKLIISGFKFDEYSLSFSHNHRASGVRRCHIYNSNQLSILSPSPLRAMVKGVQMNEPAFRPRLKPKSNIRRSTYALLAIGTLLIVLSNVYYIPGPFSSSSASVPLHASQILEKCASLDTKPGPSPTFHTRVVSDRFQPGTKPILIRNATIWTGNVDGLEVVKGDIFVDRGIIKAVGSVGRELLNGGGDLVTIDAKVRPACWI